MICELFCEYDFCFFFKQKTAYEMRISDWSSDGCSADLAGTDMPPKPSEPTDPHAGHQMPSAPATDAHHAHAGHEPGIPDPPVGPPSAAALSGPSHAADAFFGAATMAPAREVVRKEHGDIKSGMILIDQLEAVIGKGKDGYAWNGQGWYGGDIEIGRANV